jgi:hypothetical protein
MNFRTLAISLSGSKELLSRPSMANWLISINLASGPTSSASIHKITILEVFSMGKNGIAALRPFAAAINGKENGFAGGSPGLVTAA